MEEKKIKIFDFINDITFNKYYIMNEDNEKVYNIYMINRFLSMFYDTLMYVFYIEKFHTLPKHIHYKFLLYAIDKKKRYIKYFKMNNIDDLKYITEYYKVSDQKGMEYMRLMSKQQISEIKDKYKHIKL